MPQTRASLDSKPAAIEPPRCPRCNRPTMFTGIESGPGGSYLQIFECPVCGYTKKITDEIK